MVLWTMPQVDPSDERARVQYASLVAFESLGALGFPIQAWLDLRAAFPDLPDPAQLPAANFRAFADAWTLGPGRPTQLAAVPEFLKTRLIACDTLDNNTALSLIDEWLGKLDSRKDQPVEDRMIPVTQIDGQIETLYFDGPTSNDWPAFVRVGTRYLPLLGSEYFLDL